MNEKKKIIEKSRKGHFSEKSVFSDTISFFKQKALFVKNQIFFNEKLILVKKLVFNEKISQ